MLYRFRSSLLGKQILQVSEGPKQIESRDRDGTADGKTFTITVWHDADRYEAELLLRIHETNKGE